jgi:hypothetical protein
MRRSSAARVLVACAVLQCARASSARADDGGPQAAATHDGPLREYFGGHGVTASPFGLSSSDWGLGFAFDFGVGWAKLPLLLGVDVSAVWWGTSTSPASVNLGDRVAAVDLTRSDNTIFFDAWLRLQPWEWKVRPYLEGVAGFKEFYTDYTLHFTDGSGSTRRTTAQNGVSSLGFGAGLDVMFARNEHGAKAYATLGVRRLIGGRASFTSSPLPASGARAGFGVATDTTIVTLGVAVVVSP